MKRLFPSLPKPPVLGDVFQAFPAHIAPLMHYHDTLLRGPSDLSVGERERFKSKTCYVDYGRSLGIMD